MNDLPGVMVQARHLLKPDGIFLAVMVRIIIIAARSLTSQVHLCAVCRGWTVISLQPDAASVAPTRPTGLWMQAM